jgi:hypothetical protein
MRGFVSSYNKKPQTLIVVLGLFFNKTWDFTIILMQFLIKQISTDLCKDVHIHIVV